MTFHGEWTNISKESYFNWSISSLHFNWPMTVRSAFGKTMDDTYLALCHLLGRVQRWSSAHQTVPRSIPIKNNCPWSDWWHHRDKEAPAMLVSVCTRVESHGCRSLEPSQAKLGHSGNDMKRAIICHQDWDPLSSDENPRYQNDDDGHWLRSRLTPCILRSRSSQIENKDSWWKIYSQINLGSALKPLSCCFTRAAFAVDGFRVPFSVVRSLSSFERV